jgi:hypothetical protein
MEFSSETYRLDFRTWAMYLEYLYQYIYDWVMESTVDGLFDGFIIDDKKNNNDGIPADDGMRNVLRQ